VEFSGLKAVKQHYTYQDAIVRLIVLAAPIVFLTQGYSQVNQFPLEVSGRIVDGKNGAPVSAANIQIVGTGWGTSSNPNGYFEFRSIPAGTYRLKISHVAYTDKILEAVIQPGIPQYLSVDLASSVVALPDVSVEFPRAREDITRNTLIIDRQTIERSHARTVGDLLADQAMVFVKEKGAAGSQFASIRGSASNQVLVILDGRRLNDPGSGDVDLSTIPVDAIERVEIIRGPSPEHGGEAIGGVIQIITRSLNTTSKRNLEVGGGSFGTRQGQFYLSRDGNPGVAFIGSIAGSTGEFGYTDRLGHRQIRENPDFRSDNLFWKAQGWISSWKLTFTASQYHTERGIPGDLDQLTPNARLDQRMQDVDLAIDHVWKHAELQSVFYGGQDVAHHQNPMAFVPLDARHTEKNAGANLSLKYEIISNLQLRIGHESRWDAMISPSVEGGEAHRWSHGTFLQARYERSLPGWVPLPHLNLKATIRHDQFTYIQPQWTYQSGFFLGREGDIACHLRGNMGTAFRVPTFTSLFWKEDVFARGNPDLLPESSRNRELGAGINISRVVKFQLDITRFWQDIDSIILWRRGFDGRWAPYNVSHAEIDGFELSARLSPMAEWTWLEYSGTFLKPINRSGESNYDGKDLTYRPRQVSRLSTGTKWKGWWLDYGVQWVSRRYIRESNSIPLAAEGMGPYRIMNLTLGKQLSALGGQWQIKGEIRNLEDREYRVVERSPMPGREWRASFAVDVP
jgi:vitamin B12 transporter